MFKFGVDTFIWSENFKEADLDLIDKAKELGFEVLDIAIAHPEDFPTKKVKTFPKNLLKQIAVLELTIY